MSTSSPVGKGPMLRASRHGGDPGHALAALARPAAPTAPRAPCGPPSGFRSVCGGAARPWARRNGAPHVRAHAAQRAATLRFRETRRAQPAGAAGPGGTRRGRWGDAGRALGGARVRVGCIKHFMTIEFRVSAVPWGRWGPRDRRGGAVGPLGVRSQGSRPARPFGPLRPALLWRGFQICRPPKAPRPGRHGRRQGMSREGPRVQFVQRCLGKHSALGN